MHDPLAENHQRALLNRVAADGVPGPQDLITMLLAARDPGNALVLHALARSRAMPLPNFDADLTRTSSIHSGWLIR